LVHVLEFVVELFCNAPAPQNYLWQFSIFRQLDEEEKGSVVLPHGLRFEKAVERLVNRKVPEAARLQLDSLSSLLMDNPLQAAFLYWAWVDIELNKAYRKVLRKAPPIGFPHRVDDLTRKWSALANCELDLIKRIKMARSNRRNPMVHDGVIPKDEDAIEDFWLCCKFIKLLKHHERN
jgi:hypothetical protein